MDYVQKLASDINTKFSNQQIKYKLKILTPSSSSSSLSQNQQKILNDDCSNEILEIVPSKIINSTPYSEIIACNSRIPTHILGYNLDISRIHPYAYRIEFDPKLVSSLMLLDNNIEYLDEYSQLLPILGVNNSRLAYTINAFTFALPDATVNDALKFYISSDIEHVSSVTPSNSRVSSLIHCLASSGYKEYIYKLASYLSMGLDLITQPTILYRFTKNKSQFRGILTAFNDEHHWYVSVSFYEMIKVIDGDDVEADKLKLCKNIAYYVDND